MKLETSEGPVIIQDRAIAPTGQDPYQYAAERAVIRLYKKSGFKGSLDARARLDSWGKGGNHYQVTVSKKGSYQGTYWIVVWQKETK